MVLNHLSLTDENGFQKEKIPFKSVSSGFDHKLVIDIPFDTKIIESITIGPDCKLTEKDVNEMLFAYSLYNENTLHQKKQKECLGDTDVINPNVGSHMQYLIGNK